MIHEDPLRHLTFHFTMSLPRRIVQLWRGVVVRDVFNGPEVSNKGPRTGTGSARGHPGLRLCTVPPARRLGGTFLSSAILLHPVCRLGLGGQLKFLPEE